MGWPDDSNHYYQTFERAALREAEIIEGLSLLCSDLIRELAMYRETDREEEAMQKILSNEDNKK